MFLKITDEFSEYEDIRLDKFLSVIYTDYSRSYIQRLIDGGDILVDGKAVRPSYKIKFDDNISINIPKPVTLSIEPQAISLDIAYEDNDIIVINKPKGMVVHPAAGHYTDTLVNALMYHCKDSLSTINGVLRPGIVHRIDKDTTGLLVACKNDSAHKALAEAFKAHDITRVYTAIVCNHFAEPEGTVDKPIARAKNDRKRMAVDMSGRRAVTHYRVIDNLDNNYALIECRLETGRTHQIRVHMASINHALLGDEVYGKKSKLFNTNGQTLHAGVLGFKHPTTGEYMEFRSELPNYFKNILKRLGYEKNIDNGKTKE